VLLGVVLADDEFKRCTEVPKWRFNETTSNTELAIKA
jgi:hypothetical protein